MGAEASLPSCCTEPGTVEGHFDIIQAGPGCSDPRFESEDFWQPGELPKQHRSCGASAAEKCRELPACGQGAFEQGQDQQAELMRQIQGVLAQSSQYPLATVTTIPPAVQSHALFQHYQQQFPQHFSQPYMQQYSQQYAQQYSQQSPQQYVQANKALLQSVPEQQQLAPQLPHMQAAQQVVQQAVQQPQQQVGSPIVQPPPTTLVIDSFPTLSGAPSDAALCHSPYTACAPIVPVVRSLSMLSKFSEPSSQTVQTCPLTPGQPPRLTPPSTPWGREPPPSTPPERQRTPNKVDLSLKFVTLPMVMFDD